MLKRIVSGNLLTLILCLALTVPVYAKSVSVRGYYRKDGTYVRPHMRSSPDGNFWNNWSTKGNVNPYTGEMGTKTTPYGGTGIYSPYSSGTYSMPFSSPYQSNPYGMSSPFVINSPVSMPLSTAPSSINSATNSAYGSGAYGGGAAAGGSNFTASALAAQTSLPSELEPTATKFFRAGDFPDAIIWYTAAVSRSNTQALREKLALSYLNLASNADQPTAMQLLHTSMAINFSPQAEENLNNLIQGMGYDPYNCVDRMRVADMAKQQKDAAGELVELQQAVLYDKKNGPALFRLAQTYEQSGMCSEALKTYRMAKDAGVDPNHVDAGLSSCKENSHRAVLFPPYYFSAASSKP